MAIPAFDDDGLLPAGIYDCTLADIGERFGRFQRTEQRARLFKHLETLFHDLMATDFFEAVIVDGSFVTGIDAPNDIDLILVLRANHDFTVSTRPFEYNVLSRSQVRRRFGFDAVLAREGTEDLDDYIAFFSQVRGHPAAEKGLLRVRL